MFIGRDLTNDIVINDAEISRRHARLISQAGGYVLEDLGSTNGTFINGQRLASPYILRPGETVTSVSTSPWRMSSSVQTRMRPSWQVQPPQRRPSRRRLSRQPRHLPLQSGLRLRHPRRLHFLGKSLRDPSSPSNRPPSEKAPRCAVAHYRDRGHPSGFVRLRRDRLSDRCKCIMVQVPAVHPWVLVTLQLRHTQNR